ncbi:MAG: MFS transporter [Bacteroidetes bacterium]|nr:MFS transporter [Bacteroidota bacterium]
MQEIKRKKQAFGKYEIFVIALLAFLQFTVVLDFMVLSPLSAILLDELKISTSQFGLVVSAYAFSAGASGFLSSGFADRFDRKKILLFFYTGFIAGTLFCGLAPNYYALLAARVVTGLFGGVMSSISFAIVTDLFSFERRGRVMGFVQMAFSVSQIMGIPVGLYLANELGWHAPFLLIVAISVIVWFMVVTRLKPIDEHLKEKSEKNAFQHMLHTLSNRDYLRGFSVTTLLATGGFMLMPFGAAFSVHNLGIDIKILPVVYMVTGAFSIVMGPLAGMLADKIGKFKLFVGGSLIAATVILYYCNLGITPLVMVMALNVLMFVGITSRMVANQSLITAVPEPKDRGAFMGINSSVMQLSGGIASLIAGMIVVQNDSGYLEHYNILGYVVTGTILITILLMRRIDVMVRNKQRAKVELSTKASELLDAEIDFAGGRQQGVGFVSSSNAEHTAGGTNEAPKPL